MPITAKDSVDVAILVNDLAKSLDFYQSIPGTEKVSADQTKAAAVNTVGAEAAKTLPPAAMVRYGTTLVKLFQSPKPLSRQPEGPRLGLNGLTFRLDSLDGFTAQLKKKGVQYTVQEGGKFPIVVAKDPDGNLVEFVQQRA